MGFVPLSIATLMYVWAALDFAVKRQWAMCLVFSAYSLANVGLIIIAYRQR